MLLFNMKSFLLSIGSFVLISSIITMLLPDGKLNKNIKNVFSIISVFLVVQPILNIKNINLNINDVLFSDKIIIQENFLYFIAEENVKKLKIDCEKILVNNGINDAELDIYYNVLENGQVDILRVVIDLSNSVINSDKENIDIIESSLKNICELLSIDTKQVVFNE